MPRYILPENRRILDNLSEKELLDFIRVLPAQSEKLNQLWTRDITDDNAEALLSEVFALAPLSAASSVISSRLADEIANRFFGHPNNFKIPIDLLTEFLRRSKEMTDRFITMNPDCKPAFRFYIGHTGETDLIVRRYNMIVMPICSKDVTHSMREDDLEQRVFTDTGTPFFALHIADGDIRISEIVEECKIKLDNKDESGVWLGYHVRDDFHEFMSNLEPAITAENMEIRLGRLDETYPGFTEKKITLLIAFKDDQLGTIRSTVMSATGPVVGVCFDQVDLIPPPNPPIADSFFN